MSPRTVRTNVIARPASGASASSRIAPSARSRSRSALDVDVARIAPGRDRQGRRGPGRLAHRHALGHRADRGVRVVGRAEAATGDEHVGGVANDQRPVRDPDRRAVRQVLPDRVRAAVVVLDRGAAQADPVVEGARAEDIVAGQPVVAVDAPRLADADLRAERDERRVLVPGHAVDEEPDVLERLAPAGDLGLGQEPRVGGVDDAAVGVAPDRIEPGHDRGRHAVDRRDVVAALAPRQVVVARRRRPRPSAGGTRPWGSLGAARGRRSPSGTSSSASGPGRARRPSRSRSPRTRTGPRRRTHR